MATPRGPNLTIKPFGGDKDEDFRAWLNNEFLLKFRANNWPDAAKAQILAGFLCGHALFLYQGLTTQTQNDYDALIQELETRLLTQDRKRFIGQRYECRNQRDTEDVSTYARALNELAKSALSYMTVAAERELNLRDKFISGLRPSIKTQVRLMGPETFAETLRAAERVEANADDVTATMGVQVTQCMDKICRRLDEFERRVPTKVTAVTELPREVSASATPPWAEELFSRIKKMEETYRTPENRQQPPNMGTSPAARFPMYDRQRFTGTRRAICQACNKSGHSAGNCVSFGKYCEFHQIRGHSTEECRARSSRQPSSSQWGRLSQQRGNPQQNYAPTQNNRRVNFGTAVNTSNRYGRAGAHCIQQDYGDSWPAMMVHSENSQAVPESRDLPPVPHDTGSQITSFLGTLVVESQPLDISFRRCGTIASSDVQVHTAPNLHSTEGAPLASSITVASTTPQYDQEETSTIQANVDIGADLNHEGLSTLSPAIVDPISSGFLLEWNELPFAFPSDGVSNLPEESFIDQAFQLAEVGAMPHQAKFSCSSGLDTPTFETLWNCGATLDFGSDATVGYLEEDIPNPLAVLAEGSQLACTDEAVLPAAAAFPNSSIHNEVFLRGGASPFCDRIAVENKSVSPLSLAVLAHRDISTTDATDSCQPKAEPPVVALTNGTFVHVEKDYERAQSVATFPCARRIVVPPVNFEVHRNREEQEFDLVAQCPPGTSARNESINPEQKAHTWQMSASVEVAQRKESSELSTMPEKDGMLAVTTRMIADDPRLMIMCQQLLEIRENNAGKGRVPDITDESEDGTPSTVAKSAVAVSKVDTSISNLQTMCETVLARNRQQKKTKLSEKIRYWLKDIDTDNMSTITNNTEYAPWCLSQELSQAPIAITGAVKQGVAKEGTPKSGTKRVYENLPSIAAAHDELDYDEESTIEPPQQEVRAFAGPPAAATDRESPTTSGPTVCLQATVGIEDSNPICSDPNLASDDRVAKGDDEETDDNGVPRKRRRGRRGGRWVKWRTQRRIFFKTSWLSLLIFCMAIIMPVRSYRFPNPLLCQTEHHKQMWQIPENFECQSKSTTSKELPTTTKLQLYKKNIVQYTSEAWLCQKSSSVMETFTYFFNDENLKRSKNIDEIVDRSECTRMKTFKQCSHGKLTEEGGLWSTSNQLEWYYPGGGINCCNWKTFKVTNCFLYKAKVYKRHGDSNMESTAGDVSHCDYIDGYCSLKNGKFLVWHPNKKEVCSILPWKVMTGKLSMKQWVPNDGTLALTFHQQQVSGTSGSRCQGSRVPVSDQGIPFRIIQQEKRRRYDATAVLRRRRPILENRIRRPKRDSTNASFVSSELLAASLQALEAHTTEALNFAFDHAIASTCGNMRRVFGILHAEIMGNPTLALRSILNQSNIIARSAGRAVEVWPCIELHESQFQFLPMNRSCTREIPIHIIYDNQSHFGFMNPVTNVISPQYAQIIDCLYANNMPITMGHRTLIYSRNGRVVPAKRLEKLTPYSFYTTHESLADVIFHPVVRYHIQELQTHISLNDIFQTYHQQRKVLSLLGMQTGHQSAREAADQTASRIVRIGFFGFLRGLTLDPLQLWTFACCLYITLSLFYKLFTRRSVVSEKLKAAFQKSASMIAWGYRTYRWVNGNVGNRTTVVTTLEAQSELNLQGAILQSTEPTVEPSTPDRRPSETSSKAFKPYRLEAIGDLENVNGTIDAVINGHRCKALFDTGAQISLISSQVANQLPGSIALPQSDGTNAPWRVLSATGHFLEIEGSIKASIQIGRVLFEGPLVIANQLPYEVILGRNFIQHLGDVTINYAEETITFNEDELEMATSDGQLRNEFATVSRYTEVPPLTECLLTAHLPGPMPNDTDSYFIQQSQVRNKSDLLVASAIVAPNENGEIPIRVLNPTRTALTLYAGMRIATVEGLSDNEIEGIDLQVFANDTVIASVFSSQSEEPCNLGELPKRFKELDLSSCSLDEKAQQDLLKLLIEYQDIFSEGDHDLEGTTLFHHRIETGDAIQIRQKPYRTAFALRDEIKNKIDDMLHHDIIEYSTSEWASPIVMVKKKDGSWRFCVDYRKLNAVTRKDSYPMKRIDDVFGSLDKAKFFCTLDLQSGYHQIPMSEESKSKTTFTTYDGAYQYKRMPFGLCNAPATFQRLMESVLAGLDWRICLVYLDDILIMGSSCEELLDRVRQVFQRLRIAGLKLKLKKCAFGQSTVPFLGHVLSKDGLFPECEKIEKIRNWPIPTNSKELLAFLGLAGYYRQFVWCFSKIASPLHALIKKQVKFEWTDGCQSSFDILKRKLTESPVLSFPDFSKPFNLQTDASNEALGAVLSQMGMDGKEHPVSFASRALNKSERRYPAVEKETLAVVWAIQHFRAYLYGQSFTVTTDHQSLRWLLNVKDPHGRLCRWSLLLQSYDFKILHRPGKENKNADALSRRPQVDNLPDLSGDAVPCAICNDLYQSTRREIYPEDKTCPIIGSVQTGDINATDWHKLHLLRTEHSCTYQSLTKLRL